MADGRGHVADLPLLARVQHNAQPGGRDGGPVADGHTSRGEDRLLGQELDLGRGQQLPFHRHAGPQCGQRLGRGHVLHLHQVGLGQLVPGVGEPVGQVAVVGQQQQSLAVLIQPAGRIDPWHGDVVGQGGPALRVGEAAEDAIGLVKQQITAGSGGFVSGRGRRFRCRHLMSFRGPIIPQDRWCLGLDRRRKFS